MAAGTKSNFVLYDEQFHAGVTEVLRQNAQAFNAASNNALRLTTESMMGEYDRETFFKEISSIVSRRDSTSTSSVADTPLTQGERVRVKLDRRIGPIANTLDSLRKVASDQEEFSFLLGEQFGQAITLDYLNSAVRAAVAALNNTASLKADVTGESTNTMTHTHLVTGMSKRGDRGQEIVAWVMHSKVYYDLMKQAISDKVFEVAGTTIMNGTVASFNRPVIVTDSAALINANGISTGVDSYYTLGLVSGGVDVIESEGRQVVGEIVTGLENLIYRIQGEHAFNLGVMGYAWDTTNGGANPNDSALGTGSNWDQVASDVRSCAGVIIESA